jgi:hypothetical protein
VGLPFANNNGPWLSVPVSVGNATLVVSKHVLTGTTPPPKEASQPASLQVPLPKLPKSHLDLSAFLADADARASVYQLPPVSSHSYNTRQQQQILAVTTTSPAAAAAAVSVVQLKSQVVTRQQPAHHIAPAGASMPGSPVGIRLQPAVIAGPVKATAVPAAAAAAVVRPLAVKAAAGTDAVGQVRGGRGDMQHHHNAATAGKPAVNAPLAVLQMTLQVRTACSPDCSRRLLVGAEVLPILASNPCQPMQPMHCAFG